MIVLVVKEAPPHANHENRAGIYLGYVDGDFIVASRQPFLDGARVLLAQGYDPETAYNMRWENSQTLSFVTKTIGHAAAFSVSEGRGGTKLRPYRDGSDQGPAWEQIQRFSESPGRAMTPRQKPLYGAIFNAQTQAG